MAMANYEDEYKEILGQFAGEYSQDKQAYANGLNLARIADKLDSIIDALYEIGGID